MIKQYCPEYIYEESLILEALLDSAQTALDAFISEIESLTSNWYIQTASGNYLDKIGALCSMGREGRTDEDYRTAILSKIGGIAGIKSVLLSIAKEVTNNEAQILEPSEGQILVRTKASATTGKADILKTRIQMAKLAGIEDLYEQFSGLIDSLVMTESANATVQAPNYLWDTALWGFTEWGA